jgi:hypothetical protein
MYTIEDYEEARAELRRWDERWANYSGNNPDKYQADLKAARKKVRYIELYLKDAGILPLTEQELLERHLDTAFPKARSKEVVEFNGKKNCRRFFPMEMSRSRKTVTEWGKSWEEVKE